MSGNRLDLVLLNRDIVTEVRMDGRLDQSDHEMVCIMTSIGVQRSASNHRYRNFNKGNYKEARAELMKVGWENEFEGPAVNAM